MRQYLAIGKYIEDITIKTTKQLLLLCKNVNLL